MPARLSESTVQVVGLRETTRALKQVAPEAEKELRTDLKGIAGRVAREAEAKMHARSFGYRGYATGTRASVRSIGPKGFVARFLEYGFHPRGSSTFVDGRNIVGGILERREHQIVDDIADSIDKATRSAGWH